MNLESNTGLIAKILNNRDFRNAYVYEHLKTGIAYQIRAMRDERKWTQGKLGEKTVKPRNVITRIEDPNYGQLSLQTLREIASAFDVALLVKFVPFSRLLEEYDDVSPRALVAPSINDNKEVRLLKRWATGKDRAEIPTSTSEVSTPRLLRLVDPPTQKELFAGSTAGGWMPFRLAREVSRRVTIQSNEQYAEVKVS